MTSRRVADVPSSKLNATGHGIREIILVFAAWKLLLLAVACASPGQGYDTSTQILIDQYGHSSDSWHGGAIEHLVLRLTRWDGIYFATSAERGHVHEQEWAFSWVLARLTSGFARAFLAPFSLSPIVTNALAGIIISHISHLLAVITLYHIVLQLVPAPQDIKRQIAFTAACLHVFSPAGLFLSSPFGESTFAFLSFTGMLCYVLAKKAKASHDASATTCEVIWTIIAGLCFGASATIRGNGLLSGIPFAWDALETIMHPSKIFKDSRAFCSFAATLVGGIFVGLGFAVPQAVAYLEYCTNGKTRPWCTRLPPSIYSWVQDHYWQVGFLRYWTLNNLPLFLLAGPMLSITLATGYIALRNPIPLAAMCCSQKQSEHKLETQVFKHIIPRFALPQIVLAVMAATSFHVQIINRISSGYPIWYIVIAINIHAGASRQSQTDTNVTSIRLMKSRCTEWALRGMVIYAIVQGGLYASFLPPA